MGISGSKDNEGDFCTPPKIGTHRRIIDHDLDPRSPSTAIARTPIVVDKTPEGLLDPRSPTVGISRTPITSLSGNHGKQNYNDVIIPYRSHSKNQKSLFVRHVRSFMSH